MENTGNTKKKAIDIRSKKQKKLDDDIAVMDKMVQVLEQEKGVLYWALKRVGISYTRHRNLIDKYPAYKEKIEDVMAVTDTWIFSKLAELIDNGNPTATIFACKSRLHMVETSETNVNVKTNDLVDVEEALEEMKKRLEQGKDK